MVKFYGKDIFFSALRVSNNDKLSDFYTSSWQRSESPRPMLVVRTLLTIFALGIFIWSIIEASIYSLIYLTNWGVLLLTITMMSGLVISLTSFWMRPVETKELPWYVSLYWVFFNISVTISIMVTTLYWTLLYTPAEKETLGPRLFVLDVMKHGATSCILLAELLISRTPVKLAHIYQPVGFAVGYGIFTVVYYLAGGTDRKGNVYIYHVLNWQKSHQSVLVFLSSVTGLIILYFVLWSLAMCRNKISIALVRTKST